MVTSSRTPSSTRHGGPVRPPTFAWRLVAADLADRWNEVAAGILGIEARLHRPAGEAHLVLRQCQPLARRDPDHLLDDIETGDEFGDRVLDLQAGIHLEEVEVPVRSQDELDRAGGIVVDGLGERDRLRTHLGAQGRIDRRRRSLLDDLLIAPLDGAFALAQVDDVAMTVAQHLDLDMARVLDESLDEDTVVAERRARLGAGGAHAFHDFALRPCDAHALAAATGRGLDHHRQPDVAGDRDRLRVAVDFAEVAGNRGNAGGDGELLRFDLVAEHRNRTDIRPDESDAGSIQRQGEGAALGQEPVAWVDRVGAGAVRRLDDPVDHQVGGGGRWRSDVDRFVGHRHVQRVVVRVAIDGDRRQPHALRGSDDATGDFAAICDEDFAEHRSSAAPY